MRHSKQLSEAFIEMAPRYETLVNDELYKFWGFSYTDLIDFLIASTPVQAEDRVLDIATGTCAIPRKYLERGELPYRFIGLDITLAMLQNAKPKLESRTSSEIIQLACADAMDMPFASQSIDIVLCGLATHHMDISRLISEIARVLKHKGKLTIIDVGGSLIWELPGVRSFLRAASFVYFMVKESYSRACIESSALENIYTDEAWHLSLVKNGFSEIRIKKLPRKYSWIPSPNLITAERMKAQ